MLEEKSLITKVSRLHPLGNMTVRQNFNIYIYIYIFLEAQLYIEPDTKVFIMGYNGISIIVPLVFLVNNMNFVLSAFNGDLSSIQINHPFHQIQWIPNGFQINLMVMIDIIESL